MSAPVLFAGIPILLAPLVYVISRTRLVAVGLTVLVTLVLILLAISLPFGQPLGFLGGLVVQDTTVILGRSFTVEAADRLSLAFMFSQAALLYLIAGVAETSPAFLPASLGVMGLLAAALFVRPFLFAAIFLELGAALAVFMLVADAPGQQDAPDGPQRPAQRTRNDRAGDAALEADGRGRGGRDRSGRRDQSGRRDRSGRR